MRRCTVLRARRLLTAGLAVPLLTAACEKVPLLAPTGSTITLTAQATALPIDGTSDIIAQVLEAAGTPPHSGTVITFTTTLGSIEPSEARTDVAGRVVVKFRAGQSHGVATITATSGGATTGTAGAVKIAIGSAAVARINVTANPGTVPAAGGNSTITANVADINGNVLPSVPVTFTTTAGTLSVTVANSDQSGNAQTTLTTNRAADVTATGGATTSTSGTATTTTPVSGKVSIAVNAVATITVGSASPGAPTAGQVVTFSLSQGTGGSPIQRTVVDWGDGSSQTYSGLPSSISHVFSTAGSYAVRVSATDSFGDVASAASSVTVTPRPQLTVAVSKSAPADPLTAPVTVTFSITATATTGNVITNLTIDFGNGNTVSLAGNSTSVSHRYTAASPTDGYKITVTATDSSGTTGQGSTIVVVL